ncbi:MAG: helix-turn-helix domain-containing protein [Steroidobacteraceae bacterium]
MVRRKVAIAFGRVLREARKQKGLSQEDLAGEAEFDRTYPSLLERGLRTPTLTILFALADQLDVSAASLVNKTLEELGRCATPEAKPPRVCTVASMKDRSAAAESFPKPSVRRESNTA